MNMNMNKNFKLPLKPSLDFQNMEPDQTRNSNQKNLNYDMRIVDVNCVNFNIISCVYTCCCFNRNCYTNK